MTSSFRTANAIELAGTLQNLRTTTLALFDCFVAAGLDDPANVPLLAEINPPLWELGHLAWFAEWYILREAQSSDPVSALRGSMLTKGDDWFDSNTVPHKQRWHLGLPGSGALKTYCREVADRVLDKLSRITDDDTTLYSYRLVLAHEAMHVEAFAYSLQTLHVAPLPSLAVQTPLTPATGEVCLPKGAIILGADPHAPGFIFDNEKWAHTVDVDAFTIDASLVSNVQYEQFIAAGGYQNPAFWSEAGRAWLMQQYSSAPRGWLRDEMRWCCERFGFLAELVADEPVRHVSFYEAQAYCAWAKRRLPTEAEWQKAEKKAANSEHPSFRWGALWEWTVSPFHPFPGFETDAYREYSAPWFGTHQVVRGASFATAACFKSANYRNFYAPHRNDMFIGFRTCAL